MPRILVRDIVKKKKRRISNIPDFDPTIAIRDLSKNDRILGKLIKNIGKYSLELEPIDSPFHALAESIAYQQLTGKAAATIFGRVCALFGSPKFLSPDEILEASDESLRKAGLSGSKLISLKDLAAKTIEGVVPSAKELHKMSDEEIIERLTSIRGIGNWTVEMMLMFRLGRLDVLPIHDYGIKKGFAKTFGWDDLPKPKELAAYGERWRPYRTIASWYLWRSLD